MISKIEVALRARLVDALLIHGEPLVLQDSSIFKEKKLYWRNMAAVASEIAFLAANYRYKSPKGNSVGPAQKMLASGT